MAGASRRSSRAQSEWNVEIHIAGRCRRLPAAPTRCRISSAALLVKVTASSRPGRARPCCTSVGDAVGDDAGLARSRAREDQHGAVGVHHGVALFGIERREQIHVVREPSGVTAGPQEDR